MAGTSVTFPLVSCSKFMSPFFFLRTTSAGHRASGIKDKSRHGDAADHSVRDAGGRGK